MEKYSKDLVSMIMSLIGFGYKNDKGKRIG